MDEKLLEVLAKNPETVASIAKTYIDKYKPVVYSLLKEAADVVKDYSYNKDFPFSIARCNKNMFDAYIEVGFTEEQALALMVNDRLQIIDDTKKLSLNYKGE